MKLETADRFSGRIADYVKYRPGYPEPMVERIAEICGLEPGQTVADIGSGTGRSALPFLNAGFRVVGVEPNDAMREAAGDLLSEYDGFSQTAGTSSSTGLEDSSVDLVLSAQAFHWFCEEDSVREFRRIARGGAGAALVWNERLMDSTPFLRGYEELLLMYGTDYEAVRHNKISKELLESVFGTPFTGFELPNSQEFDFEGVKGRLMSSSYTPQADDERFRPMIEKLYTLFAEHNERGKIQVLYDTKVFCTKL